MNPPKQNKLLIFRRWQFYLYFLLAIILLSSCEIQEDIVKSETHEKKFSEKPFKDLLLLKDFNAAYQKIEQTKNNKNFAGRSALEDQYDFTISNTKPVKIIEVDNKTFYNILIERDSVHAAYFENLLIMMEKIDDEDVMSAFILKYTPSEEYKLEVQSNPEMGFEGEITHTTILTERWISVCIMSSRMLCHGGSSGCNDYRGHTPTQNCIDNFHQCMWATEQMSCESTWTGGGDHGYGGDAGSTPIGNPESGGGSSGGGGGTTVPDPPNDSGATIVEIAPINDVPTEQDNDFDPCNSLKQLLSPQASNILPLLTEHQNQLTDTKEHGTVLNVNSNNVFSNYPCENATTNYVVQCEFTEQSYGWIHTHYDGTQGMFSWGDMWALVDMHNTSLSAIRPMSVAILVAHDTQNPSITHVYAVKINDFIKFANAMNAAYNNSDYNYMSEEQRIQKENQKMQMLYDKNKYDMDGAFLSKFANYGISLYEANPERTEWSKLTRVPNPMPNQPALTISKPCK
ncbi:MAG TPA: hypothetical protein VK623_13055 [Flavobacterium sp.]|nr:hypothetical protein [Flavobacterium sp.]